MRTGISYFSKTDRSPMPESSRSWGDWYVPVMLSVEENENARAIIVVTCTQHDFLLGDDRVGLAFRREFNAIGHELRSAAKCHAMRVRADEDCDIRRGEFL